MKPEEIEKAVEYAEKALKNVRLMAVKAGYQTEERYLKEYMPHSLVFKALLYQTKRVKELEKQYAKAMEIIRDEFGLRDLSDKEILEGFC